MEHHLQDLCQNITEFGLLEYPVPDLAYTRIVLLTLVRCLMQMLHLVHHGIALCGPVAHMTTKSTFLSTFKSEPCA
eukprot:405503-Amphidinium_carterae.1